LTVKRCPTDTKRRLAHRECIKKYNLIWAPYN